MACSGAYADYDDYRAFWQRWQAAFDPTDATQVAEVETQLALAAGDIHAAMQAQGMCDCSLASWATNYLKKLNILIAAVYYNAIYGPGFTGDDRAIHQENIDNHLQQIREGTLELCDGYTGMNFPALGFAERGYTPEGRADIILNQFLRESGL